MVLHHVQMVYKNGICHETSWAGAVKIRSQKVISQSTWAL